MSDAQTVLAVDDEPANQRAVTRALAEDCRVLTAGSGSEALALMEREAVALVIADQRMPGMTGAEFLAETVERFPAVVRIVLTGYTDVETLTAAINTGHVYHFLGKPWDARELRQVVRRGLERGAAAAERVRLLDELRVACARAQREAEQKSRLLALAAHELGTPLHILLNTLELLRDGSLPACARPWLDMAQRAAEWLARGAAQLHTASRIGAQRLLVQPRAVALAPLLEAAVEEIRWPARDRALDIAVAPPCAVAASADPHWLRHALASLLSNAVRFTPDGGAVRVSARREGEWTLITVADGGIGIAPERLADIFEPFSAAGGDVLLHGSGGLQFGARGLGLGLATVQGIAAAHGGVVEVESAEGLGSRFTLRLPGATAASTPAS
jgi:signal transduction histidine kinase